MANTGFIATGTGSSVSNSGQPWLSPTNIEANDATRSTSRIGTTQSFTSTDFARAANFDFSSIDAGSTIDGMQVRFDRSRGSGPCTTEHVHIVDETGTVQTGTDRSSGETWPVTASEAAQTEGSISDLWGLTPSTANVQDIDWGFVVSATTGDGNMNCRYDFADMAIEWTAAAGGISIPVAMYGYRQRHQSVV